MKKRTYVLIIFVLIFCLAINFYLISQNVKLQLTGAPVFEAESYPNLHIASDEVNCSLSNIRCVSQTAGPDQEYATIQLCASAAVAGDTCYVFAGTYDERVTPASSGTAGNYITFKSDGDAIVRGFSINQRRYIVVDGFEITYQGMTYETYPPASVFMESTNNSIIINNYIHYIAGGTGIRLRSEDDLTSNDNIIRNNTIKECIPEERCTGIHVYGNRNLVENNNISHLGDDYTRVTGGEYNIIRNNNFHENFFEEFDDSFVNETHNDSFYGYFSGVFNGTFSGVFLGYFNETFNGSYSGSYTGNFIGLFNGSFTGLLNGTFRRYASHIDGMQNWCSTGDLATQHTLVENNHMYNSTSNDTHFVIYQNMGDCINNGHYIVRYNIVDNIKDGVQINDDNTTGARLYHNTFNKVSTDHTALGFNSYSTDGGLINNLFVDACDNKAASSYLYSVDSDSLSGFEARNNFAYNTSCKSSCTWGDPINSEPGRILNQDPKISDNFTFTLQSDSPAIDAGAQLTNVSVSDSGTGTTLIVDDAGYFQDGWNSINPDWIAVGGVSNVVQISSIDYDTNIITLASSISRNDGDAVYLYKDSSGRIVLYGNAPDIGANEYSNASTNGTCGTSLNTCNSGTLNNINDNSTHYLWQCFGINGGANANCSLEMQSDYEDDEGSPGGGSGGADSILTITEEQLKAGYTARVYIGWEAQFPINKENHTIRINFLSNTNAVLTLSSAEQTVNMSVGEQRQFDLNNDDKLDIYVRLNSITTGAASIAIGSIIETEQKIVNNLTNNITNNRQQNNNQNSSEKVSYYWIIPAMLIIAIIILASLIIYLLNKRRQDKREQISKLVEPYN